MHLRSRRHGRAPLHHARRARAVVVFLSVTAALPLALAACFFSLEDVVPSGGDGGLGGFEAGVDASRRFDAFVADSRPIDLDTGVVTVDAPTNPCGADLANDLSNCGTCGHSCVSSICANGLCAPSLVASEDGLHALAVDTQFIYYAATRGLVRALKQGSSMTLIASASASNASIAIDSAYIYAGAPTGTAAAFVARAQKLGAGQIISPLVTNPGEVKWIAIDTSQIYWTVSNFIFASSKTGTPDGGGAVIASAFGPISALVAGNSRLYWTSGSQVLGCTPGSCSASVVASGQSPLALTTAETTGRLYFTDVGASSISVCTDPICSSGPTVLATGQSNPSAIAADARGVFWTNRGGNKIMKCDLPSCTAGPVIVAESTSDLVAIALDTQYVYWVAANASSNLGSVMRVAR